jgi:hypothetical protein
MLNNITESLPQNRKAFLVETPAPEGELKR